jgi:hypothetical protein
MGTRADFYVGRGESAEWLGSIAYDGYPEGEPGGLLKIGDEAKFRKRVATMLTRRDDSSRPEDGWPWPWEDSRTTDYAYSFHEGEVRVTCFGRGWLTRADLKKASKADPDASPFPEEKDQTFPDMSAGASMAPMGSKRSGIAMFSVKAPR